MSTNTLMEEWCDWSELQGHNVLIMEQALDIDDFLTAKHFEYGFRDWLVAIGLEGAFTQESFMRFSRGIPQIARETFLHHAAAMFMEPEQIMRAMQAGVMFSPIPPGVQILIPGVDGRQEGGRLGAYHGVRGSSENVHPILRKPK